MSFHTKNIVYFVVTALTISLSTMSFAKTLNLYLEPNDKSKVIETMNSDLGVITIFQPKDSAWVKVANPQNGTVGWIKAQELTNTQYNLQVIQSNTPSKQYQVMQVGNMPPEKQQSIANMIHQLEIKQQKIQKEMQENMQAIFKEMQLHWVNFPVLVPVISTKNMAPSNAPAPNTTNTPAKTTTTITTTTTPKVLNEHSTGPALTPSTPNSAPR